MGTGCERSLRTGDDTGLVGGVIDRIKIALAALLPVVFHV